MNYKLYRIELIGGSEYIGVSADPGRRFNEHSCGTGAIICRKKKPVRIIEIADCLTRNLKIAKLYEDLNVLEAMQLRCPEVIFGGNYLDEQFRHVNKEWIAAEKKRILEYIPLATIRAGEGVFMPVMFEWK